MPNIKIPAKYQNWEENTFTIKVYNHGNKLLGSTAEKSGRIFKINLTNYSPAGGGTGYIWMTFDCTE